MLLVAARDGLGFLSFLVSAQSKRAEKARDVCLKGIKQHTMLFLNPDVLNRLSSHLSLVTVF